MLQWLLVFIIAMLLISYSVSKNIFSPSCIFCLMFFLCIIFCGYVADTWEFELTRQSFYILIIGIFSFIISSLIVECKYRKHHIPRQDAENSFQISGSIIMPFSVVFLFLAAFYYFMLCKTTGVFGLDVAAAFRNLSRSNEIQMSLLGRWSLVVLRGFSTAICVILVNNYFTRSFAKNYGYILGVLVILYILLTLLSGERTSTIRIIGILVLAFGVFWKKNNPNKRFPVKYLFLGCMSFIGVLYGFSAIRYFVGRSSQLDFVDYIAFYFGSPLHNFDYAVNDNFMLEANKGHTFIGVVNNLSRLGLAESISIHRKNITSSNLKIFFGNTYTCIFDYYADYGISGVIILMFVFGFFTTSLYCSALYSTKRPVFKVMVYAFFSTPIFFAAFTEQMFGIYITVNTMIMLASIVFALCFLDSKRKEQLVYIIGKIK